MVVVWAKTVIMGRTAPQGKLRGEEGGEGVTMCGGGVA